MEHTCRTCIAQGVCREQGKKPTDTCDQWDWKYTGSWFDK